MKPTDNEELQKLRDEVADLKTCMKELKESVSNLVDAWRAGSMALSVVKWAAGVASACAIVWTTYHGSNMK